jgi:surface polysaccharide O-acyltransferase-like enzyme
MWKKFLYVGLPYLLISIPVSLYLMTFKGFKVVIAADGGFSAENKFVDMVSLLTTGWGVTGYWYIPFIFIVFLSSPLIDRFIRLNRGGKFIVFSVSLLLSFWALRPSENLNPIHSTLYFLNPYLFGIIFYENRGKLEVILRKRPVIFTIAIMLVLVALAQATIMNYNGNLERGPGDGWGFKGLDLMLIQKYLGTLCACGLLAIYGDRCARSLRFIAKYSFGLFFMHGLVIAVLNEMPPSLSPHSRIPLLDLALYTVVAIGLSLLVAVALKRLTGQYSRYVVGC